MRERANGGREAVASVALAVLLTAAMVLVVGWSAVATRFRAVPGGTPPRTPAVAERLTFVAPLGSPAVAAAAAVPMGPRRAAASAPALLRAASGAGAPRSAAARGDSAGAGRTVGPTLAPGVATAPLPAAPPAPVPTGCRGPCLAGAAAALGMPGGATATQAARESVLVALGQSIPALARRPVPISAAERDSLLRVGGETGGGPAGAGAGVSLAVGLPGGGPSRAQRRRDSVLHAANVARLARIQAQIRRRADSVAAARRNSGATAAPTVGAAGPP